jgi:hypothetical protein
MNSSIFDAEPFKEFTSKKFKELVHGDNLQNLIQMREHALDLRHKAQVEMMNQMYANERVSPKTFQSKIFELEKWVTKEKEKITKTKQMSNENNWLVLADTIKRVRRKSFCLIFDQ